MCRVIINLKRCNRVHDNICHYKFRIQKQLELKYKTNFKVSVEFYFSISKSIAELSKLLLALVLYRISL